MALDRFRCNTTTGIDLCFNGGTCLLLPDDVQKCICPDGWGPDNTLFKMDNCTLPRYALLGLFIANSLATIVYLWLLYRVYATAKDRALRVVKLAVFAVVLFEFEILALFLEDGWFIATSIMVCAVICAFCAWASSLSEIVALPLFGINVQIQKRVSNSLRRSFLVVTLYEVATCSALAATARINPIAFNIAAYIYIIGQLLTVIGISVLILYYCDSLAKEVEKHSLESRQLVMTKLSSIKKGTISFIGGQSPGIAGCIIMWVLGSAPFYWVFLFVVLFSTPGSVVVSTLAIFKKDPSSSSGHSLLKRLSSKNINPGALTPVGTEHAKSSAISGLLHS